MTNKRTKAIMTVNQIKAEAKNTNYKYIGFCVCEACKEEAIKAAKSVGYHAANLPIWAKFKTALKFKRKGITIAACPCGWRSRAEATPKLPKPQCKVRGCNAVLGKNDVDGLCYRCRKDIANGINPARYSAGCVIKPKSVCVKYAIKSLTACKTCEHYESSTKCNCGAILPGDRKRWCYSCRPKTTTPTPSPEKEVVSNNNFNM